MVYILKYNSTYERFKGEVSHKDGQLIFIRKKSASLLHKYFKSINFDAHFIFRRDPSKIRWGRVGMPFLFALIDK
jgi:glyceraldehyde-3-phosphate dehydrogenase/erythrose-4-phosphate dehydrogenase